MTMKRTDWRIERRPKIGGQWEIVRSGTIPNFLFDHSTFERTLVPPDYDRSRDGLFPEWWMMYFQRCWRDFEQYDHRIVETDVVQISMEVDKRIRQWY